MAPEQRRVAIIEASLPLVLEHGLAVTTRQLADAAGVAEGTLFRVFPDKEALVWAVVAEAMNPEPTLRMLQSIDRGLPLRDRLEECVAISQRQLNRVFNLLDALRFKGPPPDHVRPPGHRTPEEIRAANREALVDLIGPDSDQLRVPAAEVARILNPFVFAATHPRITDGHPLSAPQIVSLVLDGLTSRPDVAAWPAPDHPELPPLDGRHHCRTSPSPTEE